MKERPSPETSGDDAPRRGADSAGPRRARAKGGKKPVSRGRERGSGRPEGERGSSSAAGAGRGARAERQGAVGPTERREVRAPVDESRLRRPLSSLGGPTREEGDGRISSILAAAMDLAALEDPDAFTHGFHPWPARMHRAIARVVIDRATKPGARVVDPFCGSGTVLLEAMLSGRRSAGVDLNPVASMLVQVKTELRDGDARQRLFDTAKYVCSASIERVQTRERAIAKLPPRMLGLYGPHTLKEMAGLLEEIRKVDDAGDRRALEIVFSSLVVKVSNKRAETSDIEERKRIRKGLVTELFARKVEELLDRWASLFLAVPSDATPPRVFEGDARSLRELLGSRTKSDLVLTSPPYGGTYDYHLQHALRLAWLGIPSRDFARRELGARRSLMSVDEDEAQDHWDRDLINALGAMTQVLAPDGHVVLLMGDAKMGTRVVPLLPQLARIAPRVGLRLIATASQPRPAWGGGPPREEHLIALRFG